MVDEAEEAGDPRLLSTRPRGAGTGEPKLQIGTILHYGMASFSVPERPAQYKNIT